MAARACPVTGLGKGTVRVLQEDVPGTGTSEDPYRFRAGDAAILNVVADIAAMAAGGAATAMLTCSVGGDDFREALPVVEGPYRCSFHLDKYLAVAATRGVLLS